MRLEVKTYYNGQTEILEPPFLFEGIRYEAVRVKDKKWRLYTISDKTFHTHLIKEFETTKELLIYIRKNMGDKISPYPFHISPPTR